MDAVHIVVGHDLLHPVHHQLAHLGQAGVIVETAVGLLHPVGMKQSGVGVGQLRGQIFGELYPVGVDPGFQFQIAGVGLLDEDGQRVIPRRLPLGPRQQMALGEQLALVEGVPEGAHLGDDGVQPQIGAVLQHGGHVFPERGFIAAGQPLPFQIADPDRPVFLPGGDRVVGLPRAGGHRSEVLAGGGRFDFGAAAGAEKGQQHSEQQQFFHLDTSRFALDGAKGDPLVTAYALPGGNIPAAASPGPPGPAARPHCSPATGR